MGRAKLRLSLSWHDPASATIRLQKQCLEFLTTLLVRARLPRPARYSARMKQVLLILLVVGVMLGGIYFSSYSTRSRKTPVPVGELGSAVKSAEVTQRFLALEAAAAEQDQTVWAPEMRALEHEQVLIELWDDLRYRPTNTFAALHSFRFGQLTFPSATASSNSLSHQIFQSFLQGTPLTVDPASLRPLLNRWSTNGYEIEQCEFRMPGFSTTNGFSESRVNFNFHVARRQEPIHRLTLRGDAAITWTNAPMATPFPVAIRVDRMELLERHGPPVFESVLSHELPLNAGLESLDPYLLIYDLNGDARPEIAFATHNNVLVNQGGGNLLPQSLVLRPRPKTHAGLFADLTGDGKTDYIVADLTGLWLFRGDGTLPFSEPPLQVWQAPDEYLNPFVLTAGDVDQDGDNDLFLGQYKLPYLEGQMPTPYWEANDGFPSFLLLNDGKGIFTDATATSGLSSKHRRRLYASSLVDLDADHDLDLILVSDFAGIDLFLNNGQGKFTDETAAKIPNRMAFGMGHSIADFNADGALDILMLGMESAVADRLDQRNLGRPEFPDHQRHRAAMSFGNRLYFRDGDRYVENQFGAQVARAGWAWGVTAFDFDNDTDLDLYIANGHISRASAADYESHFWRHDVYAADSSHDPARNTFFGANSQRIYGQGHSYGGFQKNKFYLNERGTNYVEVAHLLDLAVELDCRNLASADLDGDGRLDLLTTTFERWPRPRQGLHIFKNGAEAGNWVELFLENAPPTFNATLQTSDGRKLNHTITTGDSYRSQHPSLVHFGLGQATATSLQVGPSSTNGNWSNRVISIKK